MGELFSQRIGVTLSRCISHIKGGININDGVIIKDNEIKPKLKDRNVSNSFLSEVYLLSKRACFLNATTNCLISSVFIYYSIINITSSTGDYYEIYSSFILIIFSSIIRFLFQYNEISLRGLNYVLLINRFNTLFSIIGLILNVLVLYYDLGIFFYALNILIIQTSVTLTFYLLFKYKCNFKKVNYFDIKKYYQLFEPFYKGLIMQLGYIGIVRVSVLFCSMYFSVSSAASYNFTMNLFVQLIAISSVPFTSIEPRLSRLRASGHSEKFAKLLFLRSSISVSLILIGSLAIAIIIPRILDLLDSGVQLLEVNTIFLLSFFLLFYKSHSYLISYFSLGNLMLFYKEILFSFFITLFLLFISNEISIQILLLICFTPLFTILSISTLINKSINKQPCFKRLFLSLLSFNIVSLSLFLYSI